MALGTHLHNITNREVSPGVLEHQLPRMITTIQNNSLMWLYDSHRSLISSSLLWNLYVSVIFLDFRSSPVHIFGNSNNLHSYARPPLASSAPNPSRGHLGERRRVRVHPPLPLQHTSDARLLCAFWLLNVWLFSLNRPAVNRSLGFFQCPPRFLMMKTWPGLTRGPQQPGTASWKVCTFVTFVLS